MTTHFWCGNRDESNIASLLQRRWPTIFVTLSLLTVVQEFGGLDEGRAIVLAAEPVVQVGGSTPTRSGAEAKSASTNDKQQASSRLDEEEHEHKKMRLNRVVLWRRGYLAGRNRLIRRMILFGNGVGVAVLAAIVWRRRVLAKRRATSASDAAA